KNFNSALNKNVLESVSKYRLFNEVKKFFQDSATSNILKLSRDLGLQSIYPGIESKAFEKIISAFDSIESENLCLNPKEKFNFGLMLMAYHVPSTAKQFFKDGQISKLEKIQIENELIDFQKIDLSKASKLQKLLVFSLNNSPEMLSGLK
ncbi:MAG: hypothetical protein KDD56_10225, partial [Bdellovibrionales bacterium]|nr:hypothetical protein [Bdellovibrionales bacterium]